MKVLGAPKVLGVIFLALLMVGVWFTYAIFTKKFVDYDRITLETSTIGLQLPERADVKIRGVIVGEVLGFHSDANTADVTLGIYPSQLHNIPEDVTGAILPKTLFGEKYVALDIPDNSDGVPIQPGATITKTQVSIEVEKVLNDLYPLLRTVQPADLNVTLNAMATALEGRGKELGDNLETVDNYLKRLNPQIPQILDDLRLTASVSNTYADVMPQIAQILRNTVKTTGTFQDRDAKVHQLYTDVAAFSDTSRQFLDDNGDNMIRLGQVSAAQFRMFAKYAPEYPCLSGGLVNAGKLEAAAFRGFVLHIVLETLPRQPRGYGVQDKPRYGESRGPHCGTLPTPPYSQSNPVRHQPNMDDGIDEPTGKGTDRTATGYGLRTADQTGFGWAGSAAEAGLLKSLLAPTLGVSASDVPDLGVLLLGPMARGAKVSYR